MSIKWLDKLKEYAPDIASAVLTGGASLPMLAMKAVADATGVRVNSVEELGEVIEKASPEVMLKVTQANNAFKIRPGSPPIPMDPAACRSGIGTWEMLAGETFEGNFPGAWSVRQQDPAVLPVWGTTTQRANGGLMSASAFCPRLHSCFGSGQYLM